MTRNQQIRKYFMKLFWAISRNKNGISRSLYTMAGDYRDAYRDYSHNIEKNGESFFLHALQGAEIRTVFDVGANVGVWSQHVDSLFPNSEIHAFELSPATYRKLAENLDPNRIHLNNFGLGSRDADVEYKDFGDGSELNTIITNSTSNDLNRNPSIKKSRIVRGETYCKQHGIKSIDLLKIDVEGAEHLVLEGFKELFKENSIRCTQFEYGYANGDTKFLMNDFFNFFESFGYRVGKLWSTGVTFCPFECGFNDFTSGPNFIAIRKDDHELFRLLERK